MPYEAAPALHATAVALGAQAVLILGRSKAGKSSLAWDLLSCRSERDLTITLVADDRVLLSRAGRDVVARPHPRIAGFIERRGMGLFAVDHLAEAPVAGLVLLEGARPEAALHLLPEVSILDLRNGPEAGRCRAVLDWWRRGASATFVR